MKMISVGGGEPDLSILDTLVEGSVEGEEHVSIADVHEAADEREVAVPVATAVGYGKTGYRFAASDASVVERIPYLAAKDDSELLGLLTKLMTGRDVATGTVLRYTRVRPFFVAISMILNERQVCPPRFRPKRKLGRMSKGIKWDDESSMLSNDRQVLDLHWVACRGSDIHLSDKWQGLFTTDGLNFDLASEFVATVGDTATKVGVLGLHEREMRELAVLQSTEMQKRWADLEARAESEARPRLREWREKEKGRTKASVDELKLHFLVLGLVKDSLTDAARLASQVTGLKVSAKTMERRFELFQRLKLLRRTSS